MEKDELISRSPLRAFMNAIQGGLKNGELGIIAAPSGIGKTSVLVQIALDKLLRGKKVIHISFTQHTDYVLTWYENIFDEFIRKKNLENPQEIKDDIFKNRVLMKFTQGGLSWEQILRSVRALIKDGGFAANNIIVDGYIFTGTDKDWLTGVKAFAREMDISFWFSCTVKGTEPLYDKRNIPVVIKDYADLFDVIIILKAKPDNITLTVSKDRDNYNLENLALKLDPKTLLIQ
ncbi:MAG: hypothetical protein FWC45_08660 [Treponema sp.]|nr:hypothetical protein [Treponema sp.]